MSFRDKKIKTKMRSHYLSERLKLKTDHFEYWRGYNRTSTFTHCQNATRHNNFT